MPDLADRLMASAILDMQRRKEYYYASLQEMKALAHDLAVALAHPPVLVVEEEALLARARKMGALREGE